MAYRWSIQGGVLQDGFGIKPRGAPGDSIRVAVSANPNMANPTWWGPVIGDTYGFTAFTITGLQPVTVYYWAIEVNGALVSPLGTPTGRCKTFPRANVPCSSFTIASVTCSGATSQTNTSADAMALSAIEARNPDLFLHVGDIHYKNAISTDPNEHINGWEHVMEMCPRYFSLLSKVPMAHVWSDHDYSGQYSTGVSGGNSDRTAPSREVSCQVRRLVVPDYPLAIGPGNTPLGGIYYTFQIGRLPVVASDLRSYRDPDSTPQSATKTMMGVGQKAWLKAQFRAAVATSPVVLWAQETNFAAPYAGPRPPSSGGVSDRWGSYDNERTEIVSDWAAGGVGGVVSFQGDQHFSGLKTNHYPIAGAPPMFLIQTSKLQANTTSQCYPSEHWQYGPYYQNGYYALTTITDDGTTVTVTADMYVVDPSSGAETHLSSASQTFQGVVYSPAFTTPQLSNKHSGAYLSTPMLSNLHGGSFTPSKLS